MTALDDRPLRAPPLDATSAAASRRRALRAPARLRGAAPARRRPGAARAAPARRRALEPLPLDRWLAPADAADEAILADVEAPVLDLGCGPGRHLAALRAAGKRGLGVDLSPVAVGSRAAAARTRSTARCGRRSRAPARGGRSCCWTATSASAARRSRCCGAPASCSRRGGEIVVETDPPGAPTHRIRVRLEAPGVVSEWFRWARVGVDGVGRDRGARGLRGRRTVRALVGPHVRNAQTPLRTRTSHAPSPRQARSGRASSARRCAARG